VAEKKLNMLWSIICGNLSKAFSLNSGMKKKQGGILPTCFYS